MKRKAQNRQILFMILAVITFFLNPFISYVPSVVFALLAMYWTGVEEQIKYEERV